MKNNNGSEQVTMGIFKLFKLLANSTMDRIDFSQWHFDVHIVSIFNLQHLLSRPLFLVMN